MSDPLSAESRSQAKAQGEQRSMGLAARLLLVGTALALAAVLGTARWMTPDPRGYGTHEQIGLPACTFRQITGVPCPSCGMTTSFAYGVRGRLVSALRANPAGCLLTLAAAGMIPWCLLSAAAGRPIGIRSPERVTLAMVVIVVLTSLGSWFVRLLLFGEQG